MKQPRPTRRDRRARNPPRARYQEARRRARLQARTLAARIVEKHYPDPQHECPF